MAASLSTPSASTTSRSMVSSDPTVDRPSLGTTAKGALVGGAASIVASLIVLAIANIGSPVRVITGWAPDGTDLGMVDLLGTIVVSVAVAAVGLAILERFARTGLRLWTAAVAVVTVLSFLPLWGLAIDTGSKVALTVMHLVVGLAVVAGQRTVRHPAR